MKKLHLELDDIRVDTFELQDGDDHGEGTVEGHQVVRCTCCGATCLVGPGCPWSKITGECVCPT